LTTTDAPSTTTRAWPSGLRTRAQSASALANGGPFGITLDPRALLVTFVKMDELSFEFAPLVP